jgi:SAM-dependent methyltransferase
MKTSLKQLKSYLDNVGANNLYKYTVRWQAYYVSPNVINSRTAQQLHDLSVYISGNLEGYTLLQCLMANKTVKYQEFTREEKITADGLIEEGILLHNNDTIQNNGFQLIFVHDNYLLIDAKTNFFSGMGHDVYIGVDSYLLIYYLEESRMKKASKILDLCCGTGIIGEYCAIFSDRVVSTDIAPKALYLAEVNRILNGNEKKITIVKEDLNTTVNNGNKYDILLCNPPYVAFPPELSSPLYACGTDEDGLGYMRLLCRKSGDMLHEDGEAYFVTTLIERDDNQIYFIDELPELCKQDVFDIQVFFENYFSVEPRIKSLSASLKLFNPDKEPEQIEPLVRKFLCDTLRIKGYYVAVIHLRKTRGKTSIKVFNRYKNSLLRLKELQEIAIHPIFRVLE